MVVRRTEPHAYGVSRKERPFERRRLTRCERRDEHRRQARWRDVDDRNGIGKGASVLTKPGVEHVGGDGDAAAEGARAGYRQANRACNRLLQTLGEELLYLAGAIEHDKRLPDTDWGVRLECDVDLAAGFQCTAHRDRLKCAHRWCRGIARDHRTAVELRRRPRHPLRVSWPVLVLDGRTKGKCSFEHPVRRLGGIRIDRGRAPGVVQFTRRKANRIHRRIAPHAGEVPDRRADPVCRSFSRRRGAEADATFDSGGSVGIVFEVRTVDARDGECDRHRRSGRRRLIATRGAQCREEECRNTTVPLTEHGGRSWVEKRKGRRQA